MSDAPRISAPQTPPPSAPALSNERLVVALAYGLFLLGLFNPLLAIVGVIIAYVRKADTRGSVFESHYANLILVFWVALILVFLILGVVLHFALGTAFLFFWPHHFGWHGYQWPDTDWFIGAWPFVTAGLGLAGLAHLAFVIWYLYRVVRGLIRALESQPY